MIVCLPCQTPMVVGHEFYTAWVAQTQKEHPVEVASCPRCGCTVADVNRGIERHRHEAEPEVVQTLKVRLVDAEQKLLDAECERDASRGMEKAAEMRAERLYKERERLTECNDAMREPMRKLRDAMQMPAQGEGYVVDSIIEDRARLQRLVEDYDRRFAMLAKIAQGIDEKVGRYLEFHGPSCDEHEDEPDEFCATCRMDTAANDAISELKFWSRT